MAKRKNASTRKADPNREPPVDAQVPAELALDDAPPPPSAPEALQSTRRHLEELGEEEIANYPGGERAKQPPPPATTSSRPPATLPIAPPTAGGHRSRHVELRLSNEQAEFLQRLRRGLEDAGAKVPTPGRRSPRYINSTADAVRWLLQWMAENHA